MEKNFSIAIIGGTGQLGRALGCALTRVGYEVIIGSRERPKAEALAESLRKSLPEVSIEGRTNLEAAAETDIVIIAVPYASHAATLQSLKDVLRMKTVIDAVVPLERGKPYIPEAGSALREAQQILGPEVSLVGAFHHIPAAELLQPQPLLGDVLICGDHGAAKNKASEIIKKLGGRALDSGPAAYAYIIEGFTGVLLYLNRKYKTKHASLKITGINGNR